MTSAFVRFGQAEVAGIKKIVSWAKEIPGKIREGLLGLTSDLYDLGKNAIQGFLNGIGSLGKKVIGKAKDIAKSVKDSVSSALSIFSPSRVMFQLGKHTTQGFVNGMVNRLRFVKKAANAIATAAQSGGGSGGTTTFSGPTPPSNGGMPPGYDPPPVDPGNGGGPTYQANIEVHTQEIDPKKHAAELGFELFKRVV
jgi:hypothetical protein